MYCARRILITAVLLMYAAQVVGGRSIHLRQCSSCDDSHCGLRLCGTSGFSEQKTTSCGCGFHQNSSDSNPDDGDDASKESGHDSTTCWVCQILGQAQEQPIEFEIADSLRSIPATPVQSSDCFFSVAPSAYHSRGPPAIPA